MASYRTRSAPAPRMDLLPAHQAKQLRELRASWVSDNTPSKPDWAANAVQCKAANDCMRERRAV